MAPPKDPQPVRRTGFSFDKSKSLIVRVGEESHRREFVVHEAFVCGRSEFFRRAMNGNWRESDDRVVNLTDSNPETFELWLNHVYTNEIAIENDKEELVNLEKEPFILAVRNQHLKLCELYVLCEELVDPQAQCAIIDAFFAVAGIEHGITGKWAAPDQRAVRLIYDKTPENSPLRKLVVDFWSNGSIKTKREDLELPSDFMLDLINLLKKERPSKAGNTALKNGSSFYQDMIHGGEAKKGTT